MRSVPDRDQYHLAHRLFVIHCKRLSERRQHMEASLRRIGWTGQWMTDLDVPEISPATWRERVAGRVKRGEVSVYMKHLAVYAEMIAAGDTSAFVLEDDAILTDDLPQVLERYLAVLPADYDMAFFGTSAGREAGPLPAHPLYGDGNGTRSMSGYLITGSCAASLSRQLENRPIVKPIDLMINDVVRELGLVTYWSVPAIIENGSETGLFAHSLGVRWRDRRLSVRLAQRLASTVMRWMR